MAAPRKKMWLAQVNYGVYGARKVHAELNRKSYLPRCTEEPADGPPDCA